jgi:hypothetical protein
MEELKAFLKILKLDLDKIYDAYETTPFAEDLLLRIERMKQRIKDFEDGFGKC